MFKPLPQLNFTQVPNVVIEGMSEFTHAEFKVAIFICRYTYGFGSRPSHKMSYSFIENGTGLHRETVSNCIQTLCAKGFLLREKDGDSFSYGPNMEGWSDKPTSRANRPLLVGETDQEVVGQTDPRNKGEEINNLNKVPNKLGVVPSFDEFEVFCVENGYPNDVKCYSSINWTRMTGSDWRAFIRGLFEKRIIPSR